jgi:hypothetical protein
MPVARFNLVIDPATIARPYPKARVVFTLRETQNQPCAFRRKSNALVYLDSRATGPGWPSETCPLVSPLGKYDVSGRPRWTPLEIRWGGSSIAAKMYISTTYDEPRPQMAAASTVVELTYEYRPAHLLA